jgi:D-lactate dehydrogenase
MKPMNIAFFEMEGWEEPILREKFAAHDLYFSSAVLGAETLPERRDFDLISIFAHSPLTAETINAFPNLKLIATRSVGADHIDLKAAEARGIQVANVPGYGDNTVAEFAFGLMLAITRNIYTAVDRVKETSTFGVEGLRGIDLKGKTLGVVGTGRIGKEAIKIANGFGMKVVAFDPFPDEAFRATVPFTYATLEDLLRASDIVTIHCPATPETFHLINSSNISLMKQGSYLVNTARGTIVETAALVGALEEGRLRGVALDVIEEEGEMKDELHMMSHGHPKEEELRTMLMDHALMKMPNVLITPHAAFDSQEAVERILAITIENVEGFIAGKVPHLFKA